MFSVHDTDINSFIAEKSVHNQWIKAHFGSFKIIFVLKIPSNRPLSNYKNRQFLHKEENEKFHSNLLAMIMNILKQKLTFENYFMMFVLTPMSDSWFFFNEHNIQLETSPLIQWLGQSEQILKLS